MKRAENLTVTALESAAAVFDEPSDPAAALASYLDDLLKSATQEAAWEDTAPPVPVMPAVLEVQRAPVVQMKTPSRELEAPQPEQEPEAVPEIALASGRNEPTDKPEWSEHPFECLIFKVAGLQLAVPLILLGAIHRLEKSVTPIPGSPPWYIGILPEAHGNLRVVDTAQWVMAGRVPADARQNYRFVIRLDNSEWALACDEVAQSFTVQPEQVKWRTARSKRPWLAGTVISHMCALIDVGTMASLLVRAEKEQHLSLD